MSKSLGNFTTIRDLLDRPVDPMAMRLFILQGHYRKPVDFTDEALVAATNGWETLKKGLLFGYEYGKQLGWKHLDREIWGHGDVEEEEENPLINNLRSRFQQAVDDDFNFTGGLAVLFEIAKELGKEGNLLVHQGKTEIPGDQLEDKWHILVELADILGFTAEPEDGDDEQPFALTEAEIENLIQQRTEARNSKNWAESDRLRDELQALGITLIDKPGGVTDWHR